MTQRVFIDGAQTDPRLQQLENDLNAVLEAMQAEIDALRARVATLEAA